MDKQKQIEEMGRMIRVALEYGDFSHLNIHDKARFLNGRNYIATAENLYNAGYRKIPENAVVIPKEISCYDNIEKAVKTFNLDGNKVDFTQEQIMALTQIFSFKERRENEIRKETAEKFAKRVKIAFYYEFDELIPSIMADKIDEICEEIIGDIK